MVNYKVLSDYRQTQQGASAPSEGRKRAAWLSSPEGPNSLILK